MKKLNLILCACAIVIAGLSVSCKNETIERKNVGYKNYLNSYTISGTTTKVTVNKVVDTDGTTITNNTETITDTIGAGYATISWEDVKTYSTNGVAFSIESKITKLKETKKTKDKDDNETTNYEDMDVVAYMGGSAVSDSMTLNKIGKKYYLSNNSGYIIGEGFECADLDSGKDFTLSFTVTEKKNVDYIDPSNTWQGVKYLDKDDKSENTITTTTTYDIKFTAK